MVTVLKDNSPAVHPDVFIPGLSTRVGMAMRKRDLGQAEGASQRERNAASPRKRQIGQTGGTPKNRSVQPQIQFEKRSRRRGNA